MVGWIAPVVLVFIPLATCREDLYSALVDMEDVLESEAALLHALEDYITAQDHKLQVIKKRYREFIHKHKDAIRDVNFYLSNPLNAFLLIKRLTVDWKDVESTIKSDLSKEALQNMTLLKDSLKFPLEEDLTGAAEALLRLQDTYQLKTSSVARGELNGVQYNTQLTAADCFELGRQSYNLKDFYYTELWMTEALVRQEQEGDRNEVERWEILEYLSYSTYKQGNMRKALQLTDKLLTLVPSHQRALSNRTFYKTIIDKGATVLNIHVEKIKDDDSLEFEEYEMLCRDAIRPPPSILAKLKCRYVHHNRPFLRIAPLKEEEAYLDPRILLYRDALYESEMETFKRMAQPRLIRSRVFNDITMELEPVYSRISKSMELMDREHEAVARVSRRTEDMTQLTTSTAEALQVMNYGIGGHYEPHYDYDLDEETIAFEDLGTGNRIATVLFYKVVEYAPTNTSGVLNLSCDSEPKCLKHYRYWYYPLEFHFVDGCLMWTHFFHTYQDYNKKGRKQRKPTLTTKQNTKAILHEMSIVEQGGATVFPKLRLSVRPEKGTAVFWMNLFPDGKGDLRTLHGACPVLVGSKWASNRWLHERGQEFLRPCLPRNHLEDDKER